MSRLYTYDRYDELLAVGEIDAVYIALPNHQHADFTIRAARRGIHVLCEKPLAITERECLAMIRAAEANDVKLMTAYRLHFERSNLETIDRPDGKASPTSASSLRSTVPRRAETQYRSNGS